MGMLEKVLPGKKDELLCGVCNHTIIQDPESGKWFHLSRDTNNECYTHDPKTGQQCKCARANPFKSNIGPMKPIEVEAETIGSDIPMAPKDMSLPTRDENPIDHILIYLLKTRGYAVSYANLIIDITKKLLIEEKPPEPKE